MYSRWYIIMQQLPYKVMFFFFSCTFMYSISGVLANNFTIGYFVVGSPTFLIRQLIFSWLSNYLVRMFHYVVFKLPYKVMR